MNDYYYVIIVEGATLQTFADLGLYCAHQWEEPLQNDVFRKTPQPQRSLATHIIVRKHNGNFALYRTFYMHLAFSLSDK